MNKQALLIGLITTAVSFAYYLYQSNRSIEKDIAQAHSFCSEQMADFHKREQNKHQHIAIKTKNNIKKTNPRVAPESQPPRINLEQLVSHQHRVQAVTNKYEFLLASAQVVSEEKIELRRLLTRRERIANAMAFAAYDPNIDLSVLNEDLYEIEDSISLLLTDPIDYQRYESLRDRSL